MPRIPTVPPTALAAFHVCVGIAILSGGERRFGGPGFTGARQIGGLIAGQHHAWLVWGLTLTIVGAVVMYGWDAIAAYHPRASLLAVAAGAVPMMFLVIGFARSVALSKVAGTSGIGAYSAITIAHLHLGAVMIRDGVWDQRPHRRP